MKVSSGVQCLFESNIVLFIPNTVCLSETKCPKELQCTRNMRTSADKPPTDIYTKRDVTQTKIIKKPQPAFVDSYNGHKVLLENSGLIPKYTKKKVFSEHEGKKYPVEMK